MLKKSPCFDCKKSNFCEPNHHECGARVLWVEELYAEYKKLEADQRKAEWEMFDLITSAYYGKRYYFPENNGLVYSRDSHTYMSREEAYNEFLERITMMESAVVALPINKKELAHLINDTIAYIWRMEERGTNKPEFGYDSRKELLQKLKQFEKEHFEEWESMA